MDRLGCLLGLVVTPTNEQNREQIEELAQQVQDITEETVEIACIDQGYTGEQVSQVAVEAGISLEVVKLPKAKKGFVLLP